ncbi:hypothetical protein MF406_03170 [Georgenia sp. TF02-10]|uniref:hypothetical protein n=1 Tax=Georgenia sp. TF02-10 TaxID=2917725 RepID=UPI001FA6B336|nr:hypothetical protein [Georgenia sp. TF02-10]UNX55287.1 hypothetical protein MF406_03170 [Georgenia sp. TF02-10]
MGNKPQRPELVNDALVHRGLVSPDATLDPPVRDLRGGGRAAGAPRTDAERSGPDAELVGAGPDDEDDYVHGDSGQDDGTFR